MQSKKQSEPLEKETLEKFYEYHALIHSLINYLSIRVGITVKQSKKYLNNILTYFHRTSKYFNRYELIRNETV